MTQCFTSSGAHSGQPNPTLKQLVAQACQCPPGSIGRQEKLNQIIFEIQSSKKIWVDSRIRNAIALTVSVLPKLDGKMAILVKVYTLNNHSSLPTGLQLIGLDEDENTFKDVVVKPQDRHIQFFFTADIDDKFSLNVKLNDRSITEYFIV